ncbi:MAG TPA: hypothetical protein VNK04_23420 [Gemmataceae bacterium]|nr:hypothetical protein [Gemmataceae bacterium]
MNDDRPCSAVDDRPCPLAFVVLAASASALVWLCVMLSSISLR